MRLRGWVDGVLPWQPGLNYSAQAGGRPWEEANKDKGIQLNRFCRKQAADPLGHDFSTATL